MRKEVHEIVSNSDEIFEVAKKIKAWKNRYLTKYAKVEEAKEEAIALKTELLDIAESMLREADGIERRDPGVVNKDIARAEARLVKIEERNQADLLDMEAICNDLFDRVAVSLPSPTSVNDTLISEEAQPKEVESNERVYPLAEDCVQSVSSLDEEDSEEGEFDFNDSVVHHP